MEKLMKKIGQHFSRLVIRASKLYGLKDFKEKTLVSLWAGWIAHAATQHIEVTLEPLQVTKTASLEDPVEEIIEKIVDTRKTLDKKIQRLVHNIYADIAPKLIQPESFVNYNEATPDPSPSQEELDKIEKEFEDESEKIFNLLEHIAIACDELEEALEAAIQSKGNTMKVLDDIADKKETLLKKYHEEQTVAGIAAGSGAVLAPLTLGWSLSLSRAAIGTLVYKSHSYKKEKSRLAGQGSDARKQDQKSTENVEKKTKALTAL